MSPDAIDADTIDTVTIDTVVVAYRSEGVIEAIVGLARSLGGRVVVVDHGDGEAARRAAAAGAATVEDPANPGFGAGQNRGVAETAAPFVLLCNPDAEIVPAAVREGARLLQERPDVAAVQGVIVNRGTGRPERSAGIELGPVHLLGRALGAGRLLRLAPVRALARRSAGLRDHAERVPVAPVEVATLAATTLLVRRTAFAQAGGFDLSYFLYGEDLDLCRRLRAAGWKLVAVPDTWASHVSGGSADSSWAREATWWRGTMQFAARWWGPAAWSAALAAAAIRWGRLALRHPGRARPAFAALVWQPIRLRRTGAGRGSARNRRG